MYSEYTKALTFENICQAYPPTSQLKQADRDPAADTSALRARIDQVCVSVSVYVLCIQSHYKERLDTNALRPHSDQVCKLSNVLYMVTLDS